MKTRRGTNGSAVVALAGAWLLTMAAAPAPAAEPKPDSEALKFFEMEVRPILAENCFKCHGPAKQKGGLRLDSRTAALKGGDNGPAVVPGNRDESLLVEAIHYEGLEMPPAGKLDAEKVAILTRWVELGAPWPTSDPPAAGWTPAAARPRITDEDRKYWAFQPIRPQAVPAPAGDRWSRNPIDRFVLARLAAEGLAPAPEADRLILIRRATFDLTDRKSVV